MANGTLTYTNFTALLQQAGLSSPDKTKVIDFFDKHFKYDLVTFSYSAAATLPAAAPAYASTFARSFDHQDWRDGEDLVAAGGIQGFNIRFNRLKADLDQVKADLDRSFKGLSDMRASVAVALSEIKDQINLIHKNIHDCCNSQVNDTFKPPVVNIPPTLPPWIRDWPIPIPTIPPIGPGQPRPGDPIPWDKFINKIWINVEDPNEGLIKGVQGKRIDTMTLHGKPMDVWSTDTGLVLSESLAGSKVLPVYMARPVTEITNLFRYLTEKKVTEDPIVSHEFSTQDFIEKFGNDPLTDGTRVVDVLNTVPADTRFANIGALQDMLIDKQVSNMVTDGSVDAALIGAIGMQAGAKPQDVSVTSIKTLDKSVSQALAAAGIKTIGDIAKADRNKLTQLLDGKEGDAGALVGLSKTMVKLGGRIG